MRLSWGVWVTIDFPLSTAHCRLLSKCVTSISISPEHCSAIITPVAIRLTTTLTSMIVAYMGWALLACRRMPRGSASGMNATLHTNRRRAISILAKTPGSTDVIPQGSTLRIAWPTFLLSALLWLLLYWCIRPLQGRFNQWRILSKRLRQEYYDRVWHEIMHSHSTPDPPTKAVHFKIL